MTTNRKHLAPAADTNATGASRSRTPATEQGPLNSLIVDEIRRELGSKRISQNAVSRSIGVTPLTVGRLLRGERPMSLNQVDQIAGVLGLTGLDLVLGAINREIHSRQPIRSIN